MLKFSKANSKTQALKEVADLQRYFRKRGRKTSKVYSMDLLSGYSCPAAEKCLSRAVVLPNGKRAIRDGKKTEFRCFSASQEAQYSGTYNLRKHNFDLLRGLTIDEINRDYMLAWYYVASLNPSTLFYAYTKSLRFWVGGVSELPILENFVLTASYGGRHDHMIDEFNLRSVKVIFSEAEADELGLEIDHDDSHAANPAWRNTDFALLIHGTQPAGSEAATALKELKGKGSYSRKGANV